jgi:hypothetical protein
MGFHDGKGGVRSLSEVKRRGRWSAPLSLHNSLMPEVSQPGAWFYRSVLHFVAGLTFCGIQKGSCESTETAQLK